MKPDRYDPIVAALKEDIGTGDITTEFFRPGQSARQRPHRRTGKSDCRWFRSGGRGLPQVGPVNRRSNYSR